VSQPAEQEPEFANANRHRDVVDSLHLLVSEPRNASGANNAEPSLVLPIGAPNVALNRICQRQPDHIQPLHCFLVSNAGRMNGLRGRAGVLHFFHVSAADLQSLAAAARG
jgi:hypothetical protein